MSEPVRYIVMPAQPAAHLFHVICRVPRPASRQVFRLPSWIRGSYLVRDFAKHVVAVRAQDARGALPLERLDKRSLAVTQAQGVLELHYRVHAFDESVRKAYLDLRRGFFNGSSLFYCPEGAEQGPFELELRPPEGLDDWKVATAMRPSAIDARGFGVYEASDYEELLDHPVELGPFNRIDFDVDGIPHSFILSGRHEVDGPRLAQDAARICHAQRELFGQEPALERYLFLTRVVPSGHGGLEHRASSALICSRNDLPRPGQNGMGREYRGFLGLVSHEYFHLWNVKRITAQRFAESDLGREAYTRDLWHYEGVTSYYDDLMLLRAGLIDAPTYLDLLAEAATRLWRTPGRRQQTLEDASFEAWIKYYQPDDNTPNAAVNYYVKGALVALCLDLHLRRHSGISLDDVMRALWRRYGAAGVPVPEGGLETLAAELSGLDLQPQFDAWLRSTEELPLAEALAGFGIQAQLRAPVGDSDPGGRLNGRALGAHLGLRLRPGDTFVAYVLNDSPAEQAGLAPGDQLVALDGLRLTASGWQTRVHGLVPGRRYRLDFFRADELMSTTIEAAPLPLDTWTLNLAEAEGEVLARRRAWLGL